MSGVGISQAPYTYLTPQGLIVPDTADLQTEVIEEYQDALDAPDLDTAPSTVQGGLIAAETNNRAAQVANNCAVANQINPNISGGVFLLAICAMTGLTIPAASPTLVSGVTVGGVAGTIIPASSQAQTVDGSGNPTGIFFQTLEQVTIGINGTATVDFESVEEGPISCPQYALARVSGSVLGWETVSNSSAGAVGTSNPSDMQIRNLRNNSLGLQGQGLSYAVTSAVNVVPGVIGPCVYRENDTTSSKVINGITVAANSIYVCVQGGDNTAVANAIFNAKGGGCGYTAGAVTVNITDPNSGQFCPVTYDRPTAIPLQCQVTCVLPNTTFTANDVIQALLGYQAGLISGQQGFVMGSPASPWDMASGITSEIPGIVINNFQIGLLGGTLSTSEINIGLNQIATLAASSITVIATTSIVNS